jgi:hypothetical protein
LHLNLIWLPEEGEKSELLDLTNRIIMNFEIDFANKKHKYAPGTSYSNLDLL